LEDLIVPGRPDFISPAGDPAGTSSGSSEKVKIHVDRKAAIGLLISNGRNSNHADFNLPELGSQWKVLCENANATKIRQCSA
jgi:hypothetical protein